MEVLSHQEVTVMFLGLGILLGVARVLGEVAKRFNQPAVMGEILAGILLGPTILGSIAPGVSSFVFPSEGPNALVLNGLTTFCVAMFLLVAGMEVDFSTIFRLRHSAMVIGICGMALPFSMGFGLSRVAPNFLGMQEGTSHLIFSLFFGIALSICALPVIAKTLMDLNLFRSDMGMVVVAVAIFHDVIGWLVFALILGMMLAGDGPVGSIGATLGLTLGFAAFMLTFGRWAIDRILPWIQANTSWPAGVLGFAMMLGFLGAAFTEWIGIHAIFGAFLVGIALGDSSHLQQRTRVTIEQFVGSVFAPLFFASIGLQVDFFANFDLPLVLVVLVIACLGQTLGSAYSAQWVGFSQRQSWAIGFALNARGAMEIVLALLALQYGVIGERLFVALVIMALVTSLIAGPAMQHILKRKKAIHFRDFLTARGFRPDLTATTNEEAIRQLVDSVAPALNLDADFLHDAVWKREQTAPTALPNGLAVPHARIPGLERPVIALGVSQEGVDFDAGDGKPARLVFLILTPFNDSECQLEILADIARTFRHPDVVERAVQTPNITHLRAFLNMIDNKEG